MTQTTRTSTSAEAKPKLGRGREQRTKPGSTNDQQFARTMVAPAVGVLFLVPIAPLLFSLVVSFTNIPFSSPPPLRWIRIEKYTALVTRDRRFRTALVRALLLV